MVFATLRRLAFVLSLLLTSWAFSQSWPFAGQGITGMWSQPSETKITSSTARTLVQKWVFTTGSDVSATPTVSGGVVYFPDWAGNVYAVSTSNGALIWSHAVSDYTGQSGDLSRVSPAVYNGAIILGDHLNGAHDGARVFAVSQQTGQLLWVTKVETHPAAIITGSPVVANDRVYIGISSTEEGLSNNTAYACCTFRGSIVALDAATGAKLWQTYDVPSNGGQPGGYSGAAIWSTPAIDLGRNQLYAVTGNNYTVPSSALACQKANPTSSTCTASNDYFDSMIALDLTTGAVKWGHKLWGYDAWTSACKSGGAACPDPAGPDYDFGSGPNFLGNLVGAGQKSGIYWALNPDTGVIVWATPVGPGGPTGGVQWGTASDGTRIYVENSNSSNVSHPLTPTGRNVNWGSWSALDAATGKILWQTADPTPATRDVSAMSVADGVVYAGSMDASGHMYALNAATGQILWQFASGGSIVGAPAIVNGSLYWGSGYRRSSGTGNNKLYAFTTSSAPIVNVSTPTNNMAVLSPVRYTASVSTSCSAGVQYMRIYTSPTNSPYVVNASSFSTTVSLAPGFYDTVVQAKDNCGRVGKTYLTINVVSCSKPTGATSVHFCAPASGATVSTSFQVTGSTNVPAPTTTRLYVDNKAYATVSGNVFSQLVTLPKGSHLLVLQGYDNAGHSYKASRTVTVQ